VDGLKDFPNCPNIKKLKNRPGYRLRVGSWRVLFTETFEIISIEEVKNAMNAHTPDNVQIIKKNGHPMFAVIPYEDYLNLLPKDEKATIPHEVVGLVVKEGMNLVKAWRKYLGLTQAEVARRAGISQAALSQMERAESNLRDTTLEKLAKAMELSLDQFTD
ncbi:MAG: helix-turn-helix transcriptional regulator, partial [Desulfobacterales bacterium]